MKLYLKNNLKKKKMQKAHRLERILGKVIQFPSTTLPFLVSKKH